MGPDTSLGAAALPALGGGTSTRPTAQQSVTEAHANPYSSLTCVVLVFGDETIDHSGLGDGASGLVVSVLAGICDFSWLGWFSLNFAPVDDLEAGLTSVPLEAAKVSTVRPHPRQQRA